MRRLAVLLLVVVGVAGCGTDEAVDSFERARASAQDRLAMSELRNAYAAEKVFYVDHQQYTESLEELRAIEPALSYAVGTKPTQVRTIYVQADGARLHLATRTGSGGCYYLRVDGSTEASYAVDTACGPADDQQYRASW